MTRDPAQELRKSLEALSKFRDQVPALENLRAVLDELERLRNIVGQAEDIVKLMTSLAQGGKVTTDAIVAKEREACAQLCEVEAERLRTHAEWSYRNCTVEGALDDGRKLREVAAAIRSRKP